MGIGISRLLCKEYDNDQTFDHQKIKICMLYQILEVFQVDIFFYLPSFDFVAPRLYA